MASVLILGAGAMGSLWATHLHHALKNTPHQVSFLSTRKSPQIKQTFSLISPFLTSSSPLAETRYSLSLPLTTVEHFPIATQHNPVFILVCTKSYHALPAVNALKEKLNPHCHLVLFQNGLGSQHAVLEEMSHIPVYAAVSTEGVNRQDNGFLIHAGKGITRIGALNEMAKNEEPLSTCLSILKHPGLAVEASEDIWQALWQKLAINCAINPFTALLNCPNGEVRQSSLFIEHWPTLRAELSILLELAGYPHSENEIEKIVFDVMTKTATNIASMLQDVRAKRPTEIEDINGFAARYLERHEICAEINQLLCYEVKKLS